ncbi:MAG TPA: ABC transporter substrate-binding protein, partial [Dehalococcoidia bacterium]|nr:ABC transporter substrate-binding protein [Dehalococcoidia bacterium]
MIAAASAILTVLALCLAAGASLAAVPPAPVKIGLVAPFSGRQALLGQQMIGGVKLALADRVVAGGSAGPIELVAYDETGDSDQAVRQARKLAADPQTVAVLGYPTPASAVAALPVYEAAGLPAWLTAPGLPPIPAGSPVVALGPDRAGFGEAVRRFVTQIGARSVLPLADAGTPTDPIDDLPPWIVAGSRDGAALIARERPDAVVHAG